MSTDSNHSNPPSTPPRTASPARSFKTRMGTMLRRNSSGFALPKPSSPFRSESRSSLKVQPTIQPTPLAQETHAPSPVVERAEESASSAPPPEEVIVPAQDTTAPTDSAALSQAPVVTSEPAPIASEPVSMPLPETAPPAPSTTSNIEPALAPAPVEDPPAAEPHVVSPETLPQELPVQSEPATAPSQPPAVEEAPKPVAEERGADYFAWGDPIVPAKPADDVASHTESTPAPPLAPVPVAAPQIATEPIHVQAESQSDATKDQSHPPGLSPRQSMASMTGPSSSTQEPLVSSPQSIPQTLPRKDSKSSLASSFGQVVINAGGRRVAVSVDSSPRIEPKRGRSRASSVRVSFEDPYTDPFADPPEQAVPMMRPSVLSPIDSVDYIESLIRANHPRLSPSCLFLSLVVTNLLQCNLFLLIIPSINNTRLLQL
ncbi:hypothetical protein C8Q75DRAFT_503034 [Abortiporus biennis]|nr:hypothetical protein C8Q75DRAFT_503034 [Abortiporus biennis]